MTHIVTDSASFLTPSECQQLGVSYVPLTVSLSEHGVHESFKEMVDISFEDFLNRVQHGALPSTAAPSPQAFKEIYARYPHDDIVVITQSHAMSSTGQSAHIAAEMDNNPERIHIFDSYSLTACQAFMVRTASSMAKLGKTTHAILEQLTLMRQNCVSFMTIRDLSFLARGGRMSSSLAKIAQSLSAVPVVTLAPYGAAVEKFALRLGKNSALKCMAKALDAARKTSQYAQDWKLALHYTGHKEYGEEALKICTNTLHCACEDIEFRAGTPLGITHAGPDTIILQGIYVPPAFTS